MGTYIVRRILGMIPMLFLISVMVFLLMHAAPGNAFASIINPKIKDAVALQAQLEKMNGLNDPLWLQYWHWIKLFVSGNFGYSFQNHLPVSQLLAPAIANTLLLAILALLFQYLIGVTVGILQARRPYSVFDYTTSTVLTVFYSVPYFIFALALIYLFAITWPIFPAQSAVSATGATAGTFMDHVYHAVLPALSLAIASFAFYSRLTRSSMMEVGRKDFTRTAYAKGLPEGQVFFKHVFRNAMIPLVTQFGFDLGNLIGGAVILEGLFSYQGMGLLTLQAAESRDYNVIMVTTMLYAIAVLLGNLLADILYAVVDPRIRYN